MSYEFDCTVGCCVNIYLVERKHKKFPLTVDEKVKMSPETLAALDFFHEQTLFTTSTHGKVLNHTGFLVFCSTVYTVIIRVIVMLSTNGILFKKIYKKMLATCGTFAANFRLHSRLVWWKSVVLVCIIGISLFTILTILITCTGHRYVE